MSLSKAAPQYKLTPQALSDLDNIWRFSAETWSIQQADRYIDELTLSFKTIATMPTMARERTEFNPPVRIHPQDSHAIVYTEKSDHIVIVRILGGSQNWQSILKAIE